MIKWPFTWQCPNRGCTDENWVPNHFASWTANNLKIIRGESIDRLLKQIVTIFNKLKNRQQTGLRQIEKLQAKNKQQNTYRWYVSIVTFKAFLSLSKHLRSWSKTELSAFIFRIHLDHHFFSHFLHLWKAKESPFALDSLWHLEHFYFQFHLSSNFSFFFNKYWRAFVTFFTFQPYRDHRFYV